jgi:hypothetical protein
MTTWSRVHRRPTRRVGPQPPPRQGHQAHDDTYICDLAGRALVYATGEPSGLSATWPTTTDTGVDTDTDTDTHVRAGRSDRCGQEGDRGHRQDSGRGLADVLTDHVVLEVECVEYAESTARFAPDDPCRDGLKGV